MKKVIVQTEFIDKYDNNISYHKGDEVEFEEERAENLISRGLAIAVVTKNADGETENTFVCTEKKTKRTKGNGNDN